MVVNKKNINNNILRYQHVGITGCSGFIGKALVNHLNTKKIKFSCFKGNLLVESDVESFFKKKKIDLVIHLAGSFDPPLDNLVEKNVLTTQKLLSIGVKHGLKKIIYTSSGAVYGEPKNKKSKEDDPLVPNTFYGLTKLYAENCINFFAKNYNLEYVILRFPNVYGPNNNKGVIYHFLKDIKTKGLLTIAGDGNQSRNFLHVEDACRAILRTIYYPKSDIFNISSDRKITINDLVKQMKKKHKFTMRHKPADNGLKNLILDVNKARIKLGFIAKKENIVI